MGWMWTCFGGKKQRLRRSEAEIRVRQRSKDRSSTPVLPSNLHGHGVQLKSASKEACAYEELSQSKQAIYGSSHGSKLFKRKSVRRAKSFGSSTAFENGSKRLFDRNTEARPTIRVDRLQEEVESLKRRLAEEEEEARKLRHEVCYLRSCGVLQSPDRYRTCCNFEKESLLPRDDKAQRNWQSWLGVTLSPTSRLKLEEQLRCMAADEMSKVPGKELTNGQKALIVATKLWQYQEDAQCKDEVVDSYMSDGDVSVGNTSGEKQPLSEDENFDQVYKGMEGAGYQLISTSHSSRDNLKFEEDSSSTSQATELTSPESVSSETQDFSFRLSEEGDQVNARHAGSEKSPVQDMAGKSKSWPVIDKVKLESPKSCPQSQGGASTASQTSDVDHVQARRFIDMRYQELEEKLLKSPQKERVSGSVTHEGSPPQQRKSLQLNDLKASEQEVLNMPHDEVCSEVHSSLESEVMIFADDDIGTSCTPAMKPLLACKSSRLWQPLSPIWEVDSGRSSGEDPENGCSSQILVSDSADSASTSELKSSVRSTVSGSGWGKEENFPHVDDIDDVPDDDLFTLSPRRLHHSYNPWYDDSRFDEVDDECKLASNLDSGAVAASSDEADFDDLLPIQCQSPAFSPKQKSWRSKLVPGVKNLNVGDHARAKYFEEMDFKIEDTGFKVEELISSAESSCMSPEFLSSEKENEDTTEIHSVLTVGQVTMMGSSKEVSPIARKSVISNDVLLSQDFDHPILVSIENLPKWIECQGVSITPVDKEGPYEATHNLESQEITVAQQHPVEEWSTFTPNSQTNQGVTYQQESSSKFQRSEHPPLSKYHQQVKQDDLLTLEFSTSQDDKSSWIDERQQENEVESFRLSLHGFMYQNQNERVLDQRQFSSVENLVHEKQCLANDMAVNEDAFSSPGRQGDLNRFLMKLVGNVGHTGPWRSENDQKVTPADHIVQKIMDSHVSSTKQAVAGKMVRGVNHVDSNAQSLDSSSQVLKLKDIFSGVEDSFVASMPVGGDSEVSSATSRDGDETFHDCESPTLLESYLPVAQQEIPFVQTSPVVNEDVSTLQFPSVREGVHSSRRTMDISPDDIPILGTVATYWAESNTSKSHRAWDGQGIPNSTTKFNEDQRVNWHSTPFETRLEQALARQSIVPELCDQRRLFEGVATL